MWVGVSAGGFAVKTMVFLGLAILTALLLDLFNVDHEISLFLGVIIGSIFFLHILLFGMITGTSLVWLLRAPARGTVLNSGLLIKSGLHRGRHCDAFQTGPSVNMKPPATLSMGTPSGTIRPNSGENASAVIGIPPRQTVCPRRGAITS